MRQDDLFLVDIVEACDVLHRILGGSTLAEFISNETLRFAVRMNLLIIGESVSRLAEPSVLEGVPVQQIRGLRNRIVHGYFAVEDELLFEIAVKSAPPLSKVVEAVLEKNFPRTFSMLQEKRRQS